MQSRTFTITQEQRKCAGRNGEKNKKETKEKERKTKKKWKSRMKMLALFGSLRSRHFYT